MKLFSETDQLYNCLQSLIFEQKLLCHEAAGSTLSANRLRQRLMIARRYFVAMARHIPAENCRQAPKNILYGQKKNVRRYVHSIYKIQIELVLQHILHLYTIITYLRLIFKQSNVNLYNVSIKLGLLPIIHTCFHCTFTCIQYIFSVSVVKCEISYFLNHYILFIIYKIFIYQTIFLDFLTFIYGLSLLLENIFKTLFFQKKLLLFFQFN